MDDRVLVCGGRGFVDSFRVETVLDILQQKRGEFACIIEGGARGADTLALNYAQARGIHILHFPADWEAHGKAAGAVLNSASVS